MQGLASETLTLALEKVKCHKLHLHRSSEDEEMDVPDNNAPKSSLEDQISSPSDHSPKPISTADPYVFIDIPSNSGESELPPTATE